MLKNLLHYTLSRRLELLRLRKTAHSNENPQEPTLVKVDLFRAVWKVSLPNDEPRFLSVTPGAINHEFFVVHLDAENFYYTWLKASKAVPKSRASNCICRSQMPSDYKYKRAVAGFSHGVNNPVPLADVGAHCEPNGDLYIGFVNGVTRTYWLLANYCPAFPVRVHGKESANLLHQIAGVGSGPQSLAQIFNKFY
jgi:hypothetical protein